MLTPDEASDIARAAGLGIHDAVALRALADDTGQAERIAAQFARSDERIAARSIFGTTDRLGEPETPAIPKTGAVVPGEGSNPTATAGEDTAEFVRNLFTS